MYGISTAWVKNSGTCDGERRGDFATELFNALSVHATELFILFGL